MRKPFFRKQTGQWCVWTAGKKKLLILGADKAKAFSTWHELCAAPVAFSSAAMTVAELFEAFMASAALHRVKSTYDWHQRFLGPFCAVHGNSRATEVRPFDLHQWMDGQKFRDAIRRAAITSVKAAFNYGVAEGLIQFNPLAKVARPPCGRREQLIDRATYRRMLKASDQPFRLLLIALAHSGCRPQEIRTVEASNFDSVSGVWRFDPADHKTGKKTGRPRVIYLPPCMVRLSKVLASRHSRGPLFRNQLGKPWKAAAIKNRFQRLRTKLDLPSDVVAYSFRHTFTTDGLLKGIDVATMAELLGHRDVGMIQKFYGHLDKKADHLRASVAKIRG